MNTIESGRQAEREIKDMKEPIAYYRTAESLLFGLLLTVTASNSSSSTLGSKDLERSSDSSYTLSNLYTLVKARIHHLKEVHFQPETKREDEEGL